MWFAPLPGDQVGGYGLIKQLGHPGGFGVVWLAHSLHDPDVQVAVKFLAPAAGNTGHAAESFRHELEVGQRVRSRNVARPREADLEARPPWIVYDYIEGRTLREYLHGEQLSTWDVFTIFSGVADGLFSIHAKDVVHRDVSADNIMVRDDPRRGLDGVLVDLGIAVLGEGSELSRADVGKAGNYAPEQLTGVGVTSAVDIWQFGAAMVKALTGHRPFPPKRNSWEMLKALESEPDLTGMPEPFLPLVVSCLAAAPNTRPTALSLTRQLSSLRSQVAPRERVRLVRLDASVWPDGSIHRQGVAVRLEGEKSGRERGVSLNIRDGRAPAVMIGDVLTIPADVPGAPFYLVDAPDDVSLRKGSETQIAAIEKCPSCGAPLPTDDGGIPQLWCPDPRWCPDPLRSRIRAVSRRLGLGLEDADIEALLDAGALADESELFSLTAYSLRKVQRYRTHRTGRHAGLTEAGRALLDRLEDRRFMSHERALHAVGLSSSNILTVFSSVDEFLDAMRVDSSDLSVWSDSGAPQLAEHREPRVWETWACEVLQRWAASGVRFVDDERLGVDATIRG